MALAVSLPCHSLVRKTSLTRAWNRPEMVIGEPALASESEVPVIRLYIGSSFGCSPVIQAIAMQISSRKRKQKQCENQIHIQALSSARQRVEVNPPYE